MSRPLCIYHGNCADGFGAAWVVHKFYNGEVDFVAGRYQEPPPHVVGRDVIMVDFSYKRDALMQIYCDAASLTIIDHHKTAKDEIDYVVNSPAAEGMYGVDLYVEFALENSGAMLAWMHFFPDKDPPQLLRHIEDRDLWKFKLDGTREIQTALFSYPYDFPTWYKLMEEDLAVLYREGVVLERKHHKDIKELLGIGLRKMNIGGHIVEVANLPYIFSSDAGHELTKTNAFGACYMDTAKGRYFSLRSTDKGVDVGEIAKQYGGGGHRNAAGFELPFDKAAELEIN